MTFEDFYYLTEEADNVGFRNIMKTYNRLVHALKENGIDFYITGEFALSKYNYHRFTHDIDIVTQNFERVGRTLARYGFKKVPGRETLPKFIDKSNGVEVELLPSEGKVGQKVEINFPPPQPDKHFISLPDLISLKLDSSKHYPVIRARDRSDVVELIQKNNLPRDFNGINSLVQMDYETLWDAIQTEREEI